MKTAAIHVRIESRIKQKAEDVLRSLGITPTEAVRVLYRQICLRGNLPFPVEVPDERTLETLAKSRRGEDIEDFDSLDEMFESWER
nr:MAG: DNA-damage-inducible protein J [Candidatus Kentron sp. LFY]VFK21250.1 MAG: DNA-damage-inducible protein J [Candidatus Kentron sp. LFY]